MSDAITLLRAAAWVAWLVAMTNLVRWEIALQSKNKERKMWRRRMMDHIDADSTFPNYDGQVATEHIASALAHIEELLDALEEIADCGCHPLGWKAAEGIARAHLAKAGRLPPESLRDE